MHNTQYNTNTITSLLTTLKPHRTTMENWKKKNQKILHRIKKNSLKKKSQKYSIKKLTTFPLSKNGMKHT